MAVECRSDFISSHDDMIRQLESYIVLYMDGTVVGEVLCRSRCTWGVLYVQYAMCEPQIPGCKRCIDQDAVCYAVPCAQCTVHIQMCLVQ